VDVVGSAPALGKGDSESTGWLISITVSTERQRYTFRFCDASRKMILMGFDVPFASHTRGRRAIGAFQRRVFVC